MAMREGHLTLVNSEPESDEELLRAMARDDRSALSVLAQRYSESLARYCAKCVGEPALGEDLAQDVLVSLWDERHRFRGGSAPAWIYTFAVNRCRNHRRKFLRWLKARASIDRLPPHHAPTALETLSRGQLAERARQGLHRLSAELRETLLLRLDGHLDYRSIGLAVGCSEGTARARVFSAIRQLRAYLEAHS